MNPGRDTPQIIVVDDHPLDLELLAEVFEQLGYSVHRADGAEMALDLLARLPEVVGMVSDLAMPGMDGNQLAELARRFRPDLRILLVSGHAGAVRTREHPVLPKPLHPDTMRGAAAAFFPANANDLGQAAPRRGFA
ncbi:MAG TPA: response regulator [Azospirillaceae bacterium]|nr:response regulator [Azospirillaceae bacterium]